MELFLLVSFPTNSKDTEIHVVSATNRPEQGLSLLKSSFGKPEREKIPGRVCQNTSNSSPN